MPRSPLDRQEDEVVATQLTVRVFVTAAAGLDEEQTVQTKDEVAEWLEAHVSVLVEDAVAQYPEPGYRVAFEVL